MLQRLAVPPVRRPGLPANLRLDRILLLAALGLLGVMLLGFLFGKLINRPQSASSASAVSPSGSPGVGIQPAFSDFASKQEKAVSVGATITKDNAPEIIKSWLEVKTAAMGSGHEIDRLEQILVEPALSQQRTRAEAAKAEKSYWKLAHSKVEIVSVESSPAEPGAAAPSPSPTDSSDPSSGVGVDLGSPASDAAGSSASSGEPTQATVEARVSEKADFYSAGELDQSASYDSTVRVRYDLVRQDGQWRIQEMAVLE